MHQRIDNRVDCTQALSKLNHLAVVSFHTMDAAQCQTLVGYLGMRASGVQQQVAPGMDGQGTGYRLEEGLIYRTNQREIGQRSYYTTNDTIGYNCSKEVAEIFAP